MRIPASLISELKLEKAAKEVTSIPLDRSPLMVTDACLADDPETVAEFARSSFRGGRRVFSETLTMPRRTFGSRPITITGPVDRALYTALVARVASALGPESRSRDRWVAHEELGLDPKAPEYAVKADVASFYEYVDHSILQERLVVLSMNVDASRAITDWLDEALEKRSGLPQMSSSSDLLADAYIEPVSQSLSLAGFESSRYADDFKVLAGDWAEAGLAIETIVEETRRLGLVLSTEKTAIWRSATLLKEEQSRHATLDRYFSAARASLEFDMIEPVYSADDEPDLLPPSSLYERANRAILRDWLEGDETDRSGREPFVSSALRTLRLAEERLSDELLFQLVYRHPTRMEDVVKYVLARPDSEQAKNWRTTEKLRGLDLRSPWSRLWLLHVIGRLPRKSKQTRLSNDALQWARSQLVDTREVIRAEAAWALAAHRSLETEEARMLLSGGSDLSRPAVLASLARQEQSDTTSLGAAIDKSTPLTACAVSWGAGVD